MDLAAGAQEGRRKLEVVREAEEEWSFGEEDALIDIET